MWKKLSNAPKEVHVKSISAEEASKLGVGEELVVHYLKTKDG